MKTCLEILTVILETEYYYEAALLFIQQNQNLIQLAALSVLLNQISDFIFNTKFNKLTSLSC